MFIKNNQTKVSIKKRFVYCFLIFVLFFWCFNISEAIVTEDTTAWTIPGADIISVEYTEAGCRSMIVFKDDQYSERTDSFASGPFCVSGGWSVAAPTDVLGFPDELMEPTSVSRGIDYNNCEHIFVIKDNMWSEYTSGVDCPYIGWTPLASLDVIPEAFGIDWPQDIQNPDGIAMGWDANGHRHIYAFKGNNYREYIDYNRPYIYKTADDGLSYSICTYFETTYSSLTDLNCGQLATSNYSPKIVELNDQTVSVGSYFNYDISAVDIDGDDISWSIDLDGCPVCNPDISCSCGWLAAAKTSQKNTKKIYGFAPDAPGSKTIKITVDDGHGGTQTKSFNLDVIKNDLIITSTPVVDITIGDDYQYDVEAYDPQGYYPLSYLWTGAFPVGMGALSIDSNNGLIFGTPTDVGSYNVTAIVRNSNPVGFDTANQPFTINVNGFNIVDIPDSEIPHDFILQFTPETNPQKVNKITWSISCASVDGSCVNDINYEIDPITGEIIISVNTVAELFDVFTMTVRAQSDLNATVFDTEDFDIKIGSPLCGNSITEVGEDCDDGIDGDDTNQCLDTCKFTYCGDGILQNSSINGPNGEEVGGPLDDGNEDCDNENPACCDNPNCTWKCPPYVQAPPIKFTGSGMDFMIMEDDDETNIVFPSCRDFDQKTATVDIELAPDVFTTAVVFVTDTSGSMLGELGDDIGDPGTVKEALGNSMDSLYLAANHPAMTSDSLFVGLVRFSSSVTSYPIVDIRSATNRDDLKDDINIYSAGGSTYTSSGVERAYDMLTSPSIIVDRKIIVLLSDGDPTSGYDPTTALDTAKGEGIEVYTIAYTEETGLQDAMCDWSSDNGVNCYNFENSYSYRGTDAADVYASITSKIISVPVGNVMVSINGYSSCVLAPVFPVTTATIPLNLDGVVCAPEPQDISFEVEYEGGGGAIKFYNIKVGICPSCSDEFVDLPLFTGIVPDGVCCNNTVEFGEEFCDDGNIDPDDTCDNCVVTSCGDGIVQKPNGETGLIEECEDINDNPADTCFNCKFTYCGDGVIQTPNGVGSGGPLNDGNEECDAPSNVATSPTSSSSTKQYGCTDCVPSGGWCGDVITQPAMEDCDDGNSSQDDLCYECKDTYCGDNVTQSPNGKGFFEGCDDGSNGDDADGCFDDCTVIVCVDNDGDGYGVCPNCGLGNGCANDGEDCNDSDGDIHPNALEMCDGKDNNCDGVVDEGCDKDGDGYCDCFETFAYPSDLSGTCSGTDGTSAATVAATCDCVDSDILINPGMVEICSDGIDQDCDGLDLSCPPGCPDAVCDVAGGECGFCTDDCDISDCCGDGSVDAAVGEECDDAPPAEDGDGCSGVCIVEDGWTCVSEPSICTKIICEFGFTEFGFCVFGP